VICRFRDCSKEITGADALCRADFCGPDHRRAEHAAHHHDDEVALRADALTVIRNITTAHLVGADARILTRAFRTEEHRRSRTSA